MKTNILLTLGLMISISSFSQKHKDLTLVPSGSFDIQFTNTTQTLSVEKFLMSNEITNKEFRQFFNHIKNTPNDSIEWLDLSTMKIGEMSKLKITRVAYSDIFGKLMNESAWKSIFEKGDYFTNPNYDNYPVVGVTWEGARYYCIWRTNKETKRIKEQDKALPMAYRLPSQYEWEYAMTFNDTKSNTASQELHQVDKGYKNKIGLINLNGNVSEWTSSSGSNDSLAYKVVKGGSWKSESKDSQRGLVLPDKGTDYIGFRIVQDIKKQ
jgi:formylglycine-generating enzyme required for sulfatase activity